MPDYRDVIPTLVEVADGANGPHAVDFDDTPNWLDTDADGPTATELSVAAEQFRGG